MAARVDGAPVAVARVNDVQMGVPLGGGGAPHHPAPRARGLQAGTALASLAVLGLGAAFEGRAGANRGPRERRI